MVRVKGYCKCKCNCNCSDREQRKPKCVGAGCQAGTEVIVTSAAEDAAGRGSRLRRRNGLCLECVIMYRRSGAC